MMQQKYVHFLTESEGDGYKNLRCEISHLRVAMDHVITQLQDIDTIPQRYKVHSVNSHFNVLDGKTGEIIARIPDNVNAVKITERLNHINHEILLLTEEDSGKLNSSGVSGKGLANGKVTGALPLLIQLAEKISKVAERQMKIEEGTKHTITIEGLQGIVQVLAVSINRYVTKDFISKHSAAEARRRIGTYLRGIRSPGPERQHPRDDGRDTDGE